MIRRLVNRKRPELDVAAAMLALGLGLVALCMLAFPAQALAADAAAGADADADDAPVVKVGYYENEVFQEGARDGVVKSGYAYEYYRKISEYTGWKYDYVYGDYGDLYQQLLDGEIDLLAGLARTEERADAIGYPDLPMGNETYNLVKHDDADAITADPATLSGATIGVLDSAMAGILDKFLDANGVKATVKTYRDYTALFDAFDSGELDLLAAEGDGAYGRDRAEVLMPFGASDYYLCVSKKRADLLADLDAAQMLLDVEEPNYLPSLRAKYYSASISARAFSAVEKEWLGSHDELRVGYLDNYLPYSGTDDAGQPTGIVTDIVPEMLGKLGLDGLEVTYAGFASYDEMIAAVGSGAIDTAFPVGGGLYFSEENGLYQSVPVASAHTELVFLGAFTDDTTTRFAVNANNSMQYYFVRSNFPDAQIDFYPSIDACLEAVLARKATCTTLNGLRANEILKNNRYQGLALQQLAMGDERCFGVEIGNEGLLKLLNRGINVVGADYAQSISYRYANALHTYDLADVILDNIALFAGLALAIAAVIVALLVRDARRTRRQMADKESARAALEGKNAELEASQEALEAQKEALGDALAEAERANSAKTTFLNNMSHDIRTPMNAIIGFTALASAHIDDTGQVRDYLDKISVSSQHLLALVNDVLDMSRIESGKMSLDETDVHLPELVGEIEAIMQASAATKHIDFSVDMRGVEHVDIVTDKLRLNQVLLNVVSNAVKFTPDGGAVSFRIDERRSADPDTARLEFRVKDNGIGMSEEFLKTIFEAFTRERTSTVSGIQGTGLGMAITKSIVDLMGGAISVSSREGEGTEFTIELPCKISGAANASAGGGHDHIDLAGKRALLAEDNEMNQMIAEAILTDKGMEIEIAGDGQVALEMVAGAPAGYFDVVLMDIQMPRMDGYEAARRIRALDDPAKAGMPIVAVTANAFEEDRQAALEAGMDGHLAKPYDVAKMMETLNALIGSGSPR